jgi:hypothetical protein
VDGPRNETRLKDKDLERLAAKDDVSSTSTIFTMNSQRNMLSKPWLFCVGVISFIALFSLFRIPFTKSSPVAPCLTNSGVGIIHVVMFDFKEEVKAEEIMYVRFSFPGNLATSLQIDAD